MGKNIEIRLSTVSQDSLLIICFDSKTVDWIVEEFKKFSPKIVMRVGCKFPNGEAYSYYFGWEGKVKDFDAVDMKYWLIKAILEKGGHAIQEGTYLLQE
jgi:hypothetical protein